VTALIRSAAAWKCLFSRRRLSAVANLRHGLALLSVQWNFRSRCSIRSHYPPASPTLPCARYRCFPLCCHAWSASLRHAFSFRSFAGITTIAGSSKELTDGDWSTSLARTPTDGKRPPRPGQRPAPLDKQATGTRHHKVGCGVLLLQLRAFFRFVRIVYV